MVKTKRELIFLFHLKPSLHSYYELVILLLFPYHSTYAS